MNLNEDVTTVTRKSYYPKFHGEGFEYAKIWIVNLVLTILTFGIYSAWAKVRTLKYFYGSVELNSSRFDFTGNPIAILKGRIIAAIILALYFTGSNIHPLIGLLGIISFYFTAPWIFTKSLQFRLRYTSFRNVNFSFRGTPKAAYKIWFKYVTVPTILSMTTVLAGLFLNMETQKSAMLLLLTIPNLIALIYVLIIASKALAEIYNFIYQDIYYGDTKSNMNADKESISKEVIRRYIKVSLMALGAIILLGSLLFVIPVFASVYFLLVYASFALVALYLQFLFIQYIWSRLMLGEDKALFKMNYDEFAKIAFTNLILTALTFGLYYPWAAVRLRRYKIENRGIKTEDPTKYLNSNNSEDRSAAGAELDSAFDIGFEIGL